MQSQYKTIANSDSNWHKLAVFVNPVNLAVVYRIAEYNPNSGKYRFITADLDESTAIDLWRQYQTPLQMTLFDLMAAIEADDASGIKRQSLIKRLISFVF